MKIAFYKGTRPGYQGVYNRLVRFVESGPYSHCEIIFSDNQSGSSSFIDGGVRLKVIEYSSDNWDFLEISDERETAARQWFMAHIGQGYDILGNLRFLFALVRQEKKSWFCSESISAALGMTDPYRYEPNILYSTLKFSSGK